MVRNLLLIRYTTFADVMDRIGHVPEERVLVDPGPGQATIEDMFERAAKDNRLYELIEGVLVEKPMGWREARLAAWIQRLLGAHVDVHNLGVLNGPDGGILFRYDTVRMPDVSFVAWESVDDPSVLEDPPNKCLDVPPDLAIEVLSESNTHREMTLKLAEYAKAGVKLVWYVDPDRKEVDVYPKGNPRRKKTLGMTDVLDGGSVLPGFTLPVSKIFEKRAPLRPTKRKPRK